MPLHAQLAASEPRVPPLRNFFAIANKLLRSRMTEVRRFTIRCMSPRVTGLIPMAHVAGVQRSVTFYELLGLKVRNTLKAADETLVWAHVECELAELMFTRADAPVLASQEAVLFYLYSPDLVALREYLLAKGVSASVITYPRYMPGGEMRVEDPDGYVLLIGQAG